jgi:hypothetical protein
MKHTALLLVVLMLSGCGLAARMEARDDYKVSTAKYKECLGANSAAPQRCEGLRLAMEADERKFNAITASQGDGRTANINIQNR